MPTGPFSPMYKRTPAPATCSAESIPSGEAHLKRVELSEFTRLPSACVPTGPLSPVYTCVDSSWARLLTRYKEQRAPFATRAERLPFQNLQNEEKT